MWIKYIQLKNFQNIKTGLKVNEIEIDFSNRENVICLLVGPNGIGKTSLLSCLTPFATLGNLDIRDSNQLVIRGRNGYKKIIIIDGQNEYIIQHIYTATKDTHSVKSYIMRDNVELNANGNVTSFKELVSEYLSIDMDYLKLIRLGDNVTNLIKLKSTDRKNFMSKFLDSVDVYLKYYQKISSDVKDMKLIISHTLDKIRRLGIEDVDIANEDIKVLKQAISIKKKDIDDCNKMIGDITSKISELPEVNNSEIKTLQNKLNRFNKAMSSSEYVNNDVKEISDVIQELEKEISKLDGIIIGLKQERITLNKMMEDTLEEKDSLVKEYENAKNNSNVISLFEHKNDLITKRDALVKVLPKVSYPDLTINEVDEFVVKLKNIQHILNTTYEFGETPIYEALKVLRNNRNISEVIASKLVSMEKNKVSTQKTYLDKIIDKYKNITFPKCTNCQLINMYNDIMIVKDMKPVKDKGDHSPEFWEMVNAIYDNLKITITEIEDMKDIIRKLPDNIQKWFYMDKIFTNIEKCKPIYDDKIINQLMRDVTELDNYNNLINEINKTSDELTKELQNSKIPYLESTIDKTTDKFESLKSRFDSLNEDVIDSDKKHHELNDKLSELKDLYDAKLVGDEIKNKLEEKIDAKNKIDDYQSSLNEIQKVLNKTSKDVLLLEEECKKKELHITEFISLNKELKKAQEMYDELIFIRASTSTKEGIPLMYIQIYLENIKELANTLLDIVYDGGVYIKDFDINATEFKIPFIKNGIEIPDISYASQGEQSFLSMAISFALSSQNLGTYNIPLLDEVDSTFDSSNRERFLSIIEHQNSIINCEQEFVISHNNMFSQYPVDVIDFGNIKASKFKIKLS